MPASVQCTGAVLLYLNMPVAAGAYGSPRWLGTAERYPRVQRRAGWVPVFNDLGGQVIPIDTLFQGEDAFISVDLTRWDDNVMRAALARPSSVQAAEGTTGTGDVGTLMCLEFKAHILYLVFPYAAKTPMVNAGMPAGWRFPQAVLEGPDDFDSMGTAPRKIRTVWHAYRFMGPVSTGGASFTLFDFDMSSVPPPN